MNYYGIINKLNDRHKPGIYGRRAMNKEEIEKLNFSDALQDNFNLKNLLSGGPAGVLIGAAWDYFKRSKKSNIVFQHPLSTNNRSIVFTNALMNNDYDFDDEHELFYGLFDKFMLKEKSIKRILTSQGGSTLIIMERDSVSKNMHFGGENGKFDYGLYCEHPKNDKLLIPLEKATELIKSLILEETIRAYQFLGAKRMVIKDTTTIKISTGGTREGVNVNANLNSENKILREKIFGQGTYNPDRALRDCLFIHDFPNIITTIEGRLHGNQLFERFNEVVNLSQGIDIGVLDMYSVNQNFNYQREWEFEIEFYDKNM